MRVVLELASPGSILVDLGSLAPARLVHLSLVEIGKLAIFIGSQPIQLSDAFKISTGSSDLDELVLRGQTAQIMNAGRSMNGGYLLIEGDAGPFAGVEMRAGKLEIHGDAGDCAGAAMHGGMLRIHGSAGDWCGAALPGQSKGMDGGVILVDGNTGSEAGACMRAGLLAVGGNCSTFAAARMLAGTVICLGAVAPGAAVGLKRGSLVAARSAALLPGFQPAGFADMEWLRLYFAWLEQQGYLCKGFLGKSPPFRFTGDHLMLGKGEVLVNEFIE